MRGCEGGEGGKIRAHLVVVAVEEGQEARLGARGPLDASEANVVARPFDVAKVPQELLSGRSYTPNARTRRVMHTWSQSVARLPTVVNWAGWKCVKPRVGKSRYWAANAEKRSITTASF